jgi:ribosomal protein L33
MSFGQEEYYSNNKHKKDDTEKLRYCDECDKKTIHIEESGHNGFDSWNYSYCVECEGEQMRRKSINGSYP